MKKQRLIIESIRYITGHQDSVKMRGNSKRLSIYKKALNASRKLYENLQNENVNLKQVEKLVQEKNRWAKLWVEETSAEWPF